MKVKAIVDFWGGGTNYKAGDIIVIEDATGWLRDGVVELNEEKSEVGTMNDEVSDSSAFSLQTSDFSDESPAVPPGVAVETEAPPEGLSPLPLAAPPSDSIPVLAEPDEVLVTEEPPEPVSLPPLTKPSPKAKPKAKVAATTRTIKKLTGKKKK